MHTYDPLALGLNAESAKSAVPGMEIIYDSDDARLIVFRLEPGQRLSDHTNPSTVILTVLAGSGMVRGGDSERMLRTGELAVFPPRELHGMHALDEHFVLLAVLAPRPGTR